MKNTVIIIPSRLQATRLPEKPLKIIKGKEMVLHVLDLATKSSVGDVLVATPDTKISDLINKNKGKSFLSQKNHQTGTDRVFEAYKNFFSEEPNIIINLQSERTISIVITDHQAADLLKVCDSAIVLAERKVIAKGTPSELVKNESAINAYFGDSFKFN